MKYAIKQQVVTKPEIELPKGSIPVSVKHRDAFKIVGFDTEFPERWQVIWLEPVEGGDV
jgi:hypothetical protein